MKYNIQSDDDSINKVVVAALEDLDNTFFVKYSNSEDKEFNFVLDSKLMFNNNSESMFDNDIFL
ncbi:22737_t:CDS:1, partial [Cetraspora pellucida]